MPGHLCFNEGSVSLRSWGLHVNPLTHNHAARVGEAEALRWVGGCCQMTKIEKFQRQFSSSQHPRKAHSSLQSLKSSRRLFAIAKQCHPSPALWPKASKTKLANEWRLKSQTLHLNQLIWISHGDVDVVHFVDFAYSAIPFILYYVNVVDSINCRNFGDFVDCFDVVILVILSILSIS